MTKKIKQRKCHQNAVLLFAGELGLVDVVVAVGTVVLGQLFAVELAQFSQRARLHDQIIEAGRLGLRTVKHVRRVLVVDDRLAQHFAGQHGAHLWIFLTHETSNESLFFYPRS